MTKKQREALTALRDVMREYDIEIIYLDDFDWCGFDILAGDFATKQTSGACAGVIRNTNEISHHSLTEILEQETE